METTAICSTLDAVGLERTRFFARQLVGHQDFMDMQNYFLNRLRHHNRMLHGWGVVCGLKIRRIDGSDCKVEIQAGHALGPQGDDIIVTENVTIDLCKQGVDGNVVSPCAGDDPWCSDIRVNRPANRRLYLAVRYAECLTRPVQVMSNGCGCDEGNCEYSRVRSSYAIAVLNQLPDGYSDPMQPPDGDYLLRCQSDEQGNPVARDCPPCPKDPWVILADVVFSENGKISEVDCFAHRRYVVSFADFYFMCGSRKRPAGEAVANNVMTAVGMVAEKAPDYLVGLKRADDTIAYLPIYAEMHFEPGETVESFLAREGARAYIDPATDERVTLAELYAMAGPDPKNTISSISDAVRPLEGMTIRAEDLRSDKSVLMKELDQNGAEMLAREYADIPAAAARLPVVAIRGVSDRSTLGQKVESMNVGDVAGMTREGFIALALTDVEERQKASVENQAGAVWDKATRVAGISRRWRG